MHLPPAGQGRCGFNTQPPEGGWTKIYLHLMMMQCFNTQPPEGGWLPAGGSQFATLEFQHTAARRRLVTNITINHCRMLFQHTAARRRLGPLLCPNSQNFRFQHTAARRRLASPLYGYKKYWKFQHTAARRRLASFGGRYWLPTTVSTHSRPKAAGSLPKITLIPIRVSTHSRPKAAGKQKSEQQHAKIVSTHSRPKAAGITYITGGHTTQSFNTQPPEGGWSLS